MNVQRLKKASILSRFGIKIFLLFVLCALIPLLAISGISYVFVTNQLKRDAYYRLRQQSKTRGFEIYERLIYLETELAFIAKEVNERQWKPGAFKHYDPITREGNRFMGVIHLRSDGSAIPILGSAIISPPVLSPSDISNLEKNHRIIKIQKNQIKRPDLFMVTMSDAGEPAKGYLVGQIDPLYLWGIGAEGALSFGVEMVVLQPGIQVLVSSIQNDEFSRSLIKKIKDSDVSGVFESRHQGRTYLNSYWSLFLNHRFMISDWIVILSQSRSSILSPVSEFSTIFFLLILLTLWIIILLALINIRKRMQPVKALKYGARKIASGDLEYRVETGSGDEFEIVAQAFNEMTQQLRKSQAMLVQAAKMSTFGQMAAGIVHEIGQPLSAIIGYTDLMLHTIRDEKALRFLNIMQTETVRLTEIISKFKTFSRTSLEVFSPVQINDNVQQVHKLLEHQLKIKDVQMSLDLQGDLPKVNGDKNALQQVFLNLCMNAIDAFEDEHREDRLIHVRTYSKNGKLYAEIEDNGCGIEPQHQEHIYEPFFTTKSEEMGTGLGLAILQSILHKHEASIELESEVNKGTRFLMIFPIAQSSP